MRGFDDWIIVFCNQFAQRWHTFDEIVVFFSNSDLMKGGVVLACFWWAWFQRGQENRLHRSYLLSALLGAVIALFIARFLAHALPLRVRPILDASLHFRKPAGVPDQSNWTVWSSFPSDHAGFFIAISLGIWLASRRLGLLALGWSVFVILAGKMISGQHTPLDVAAGATVAIVELATVQYVVRKKLGGWLDKLSGLTLRYSALSSAIVFLIAFEVSSTMIHIRAFLGLLAAMRRHVLLGMGS